MKNVMKALAVALCLIFALSAFAACEKKPASTDEPGTKVAETDAPKANKGVKVIDISLTDEEYGFGVSKDDDELLTKANEYIAQIKEDGTLDAIINNYFGDGTPATVVSAEEDSSKDQLIVATNAAFPPFEATEGENYTGIDMELAKGLADFLGKELVIKNIEFDTVLPTVDAGQADIAITGLTINETRKKTVNFTDSYYTASQVLVIPADDTTFNNVTDYDELMEVLNGLTSETKIGVQKGTTGQFYVVGDADWDFPGLAAECVAYANGALAVQDMINGNVNFVIIDQAPAMFIADSFNGN